MHYQLDEHEFEQALEVGDGQGILACCSPWGGKESDTTEQQNWLSEWIQKDLKWLAFQKDNPNSGEQILIEHDQGT